MSCVWIDELGKFDPDTTHIINRVVLINLSPYITRVTRLTIWVRGLVGQEETIFGLVCNFCYKKYFKMITGWRVNSRTYMSTRTQPV